MFQWEIDRRLLQCGEDIWGDLEKWEGLYNISYSGEKKLEFKNLEFPIMRIRKAPLPTIVDYSAIQDDLLSLAYKLIEQNSSEKELNESWPLTKFLFGLVSRAYGKQ